MKTSSDPRHLARVKRMQAMFSQEFGTKHASTVGISKVFRRLAEIDAIIQQAAPAWPLGQINKVDLAILRVSVYELLEADTPPKVVIDEAIELAKEFGAQHSSQFVNGVLAHILKHHADIKRRSSAAHPSNTPDHL